MAPEVLALVGAVVGAVIAGIFSVLTRYLDARSEKTRAKAEQARFEATRRDQARATMVDERRRLLDSGAVLLFEFDVIAHHLGVSALARAGASAEASTTTHDWDEFVVRLERFRTRLRLWFNTGPADHKVVLAFAEVLHHVEQLRTDIASRLHANHTLIESLRQKPVSSAETRQQMQVLEEQSAAIAAEARARVDAARARYYEVAHGYLAGDPD
jgi:hypothetical protein